MHQISIDCATKRRAQRATSLSSKHQINLDGKTINSTTDKMAANISRVMNGSSDGSLRPQFVWWTCCLVGALLVLGLAVVDCQEQLTVESRQAKEQAASENELADTIKYLEKLEKLDKYWSEVARPRFGRSEYKQPGMMASRSELYSRTAPSMRLVKAMSSGEPRVASLIELMNSRLAQRYNSNEAY